VIWICTHHPRWFRSHAYLAEHTLLPKVCRQGHWRDIPNKNLLIIDAILEAASNLLLKVELLGQASIEPDLFVVGGQKLVVIFSRLLDCCVPFFHLVNVVSRCVSNLSLISLGGLLHHNAVMLLLHIALVFQQTSLCRWQRKV
jgi:hypothetical protein